VPERLPDRSNDAADRLQLEAAAIARLTLAAVGGRACLIGWELDGSRGELRLPLAGAHNALLGRLLAIARRVRFEPIASSSPPAVKILKPEELVPLIHKFRQGGEPLDAAIAVAHTADAHVQILLAAAASAVLPPITAAAELAVRAMLNCLGAQFTKMPEISGAAARSPPPPK
jgi:hypothetical protein